MPGRRSQWRNLNLHRLRPCRVSRGGRDRGIRARVTLILQPAGVVLSPSADLEVTENPVASARGSVSALRLSITGTEPRATATGSCPVFQQPLILACVLLTR